MFDILLLRVWISDETLLHLFNILLLDVWISDETFLLVFDVLLLGVCYQMKHPSLSIVIYCFYIALK